jgi:hypothetical protein
LRELPPLTTKDCIEITWNGMGNILHLELYPTGYLTPFLTMPHGNCRVFAIVYGNKKAPSQGLFEQLSSIL